MLNMNEEDYLSQIPMLGRAQEDKPKHALETYADEPNLTTKLEQEDLNEIGQKVLTGVQEDQNSMATWMNDVKEVQRLTMLAKEPKNTPLPNSCNIKLPAITDACYQFAARTYPELIQDGKLVKAELISNPIDPSTQSLADNICTHMNNQLLGENVSWEAGMDKLLVSLPNIGFNVKKTSYDPVCHEIKSDVCNINDIILGNHDWVTCIDDLRRVTHVLYMHTNDLLEGARAGVYDEKACELLVGFYKDDLKDRPILIYEQHCFLDLDDDDYEEPYIVSVHKDTGLVIRIIARYTQKDLHIEKGKVLYITPIQHFTDYHALPSPDGKFMSIGFGQLLLHMTDTMNTIINQLIDAGSLANLQTGIMDSRIKLMSGQNQVAPGEFIKAKGIIGQTLKEGFMPINYKEPSSVLFQLLGLLTETCKELTSSTDAMQGIGNATNVPATTQLSMIEQGMKRFSAMQRRLYRSLKSEFEKIVELNKRYLNADKYNQMVEPNQRISRDDYNNASLKIIPVADPNMSSDALRLSQAQVVMSLSQMPGINAGECFMRLLQAARVPNPKNIIMGQKPQDFQKPDPNTAKTQVQAAAKQGELHVKNRAQDLKEKEFAAKLAKIEAEITQMQANSVKLVAQAHSDHKNAQTNELGVQLDAIKAKLQATVQAHQQIVDHDVRNKELMLQQQNQDQTHQRGMIQAQQNQQQMQQDQQNSEVDQQQNQQQLDQAGQSQQQSAASPDESEQGGEDGEAQ